MKQLTHFTLFGLLVLYSVTSHANLCTVNGYSANYVGDPIPVGSDRIGDILGQINVSFSYNCTFSDAHTMKVFGTWGQKSYISNKTYRSNLNGIQLVTPYPIGTSGPHNNSIIFSSFHSNKSGSVANAFFYVKKVGNVTTSNNSIFLGTSHSDHQLQYDTFIPGISYGTGLQTNLGFANVPISRPTCNINTDDTRQTVTLPTVDSNDFKGVGTAIGPIGFSMRLNCDAKVTLSAFMTDANSPANVSSSLTLHNSSTAAGIGIQVLVNDSTTPVIFGTKKWYIDGSDNAAATTYTIPFLAKYVQTNSIIRAGTVSAHSVISFFYE